MTFQFWLLGQVKNSITPQFKFPHLLWKSWLVKGLFTRGDKKQGNFARHRATHWYDCSHFVARRCASSRNTVRHENHCSCKQFRDTVRHRPINPINYTERYENHCSCKQTLILELRGVVVIASANGTEDRGFESHQGVRFLGL
jgi:hypothetical protein